MLADHVADFRHTAIAQRTRQPLGSGFFGELLWRFLASLHLNVALLQRVDRTRPLRHRHTHIQTRSGLTGPLKFLHLQALFGGATSYSNAMAFSALAVFAGTALIVSLGPEKKGIVFGT